MSLNSVSVSGHPIGIRRGKMILSDFEIMKKSEREHRRRLRSEQVREQSKALSKRILERTRQLEREALSQIEKDGNTEMQKARDRRLMELHRRYQDVENIGYAHENALRQPNVEEIKRVEEEKNKALAKARGIDAMNQLQESNKIANPNVKHRQRLLNIRNLENVRSSLVSQLPNKSCKVNEKKTQPSENEKVTKTPLKRRMKCVVSKKSPVKKLKETKVHKATPYVHKSTCKEDKKETPISMNTCTDENKVSSNTLSNFSKTMSDNFKQENETKVPESDDNEPRKTVPVTSFSSIPEKIIGYKKESYQNSSCSTSSDLSITCTSSSISDDSSYFSDTAYKASTLRKTPLNLHTTPITSKVDLYDYKTRQRKSYERPPGLVEKIDIKNQKSAEDLAQEVMELENKTLEDIASQKKNSQQRTQDAILREKIRKDYQALVKNLDLLSKEERKLKANQVSEPAYQQIQNPSKTVENNTRHQKKMDRAFQSILRSTQEPEILECRPERPITITPQNYIHSETIPASSWQDPPYINEQRIEDSCSENDDFAHKRKISELLLKIEKLKKKLLQEYGSNLPDDVFNVSVKSLFNQSNLTNSSNHQVHNCVPNLTNSSNHQVHNCVPNLTNNQQIQNCVPNLTNNQQIHNCVPNLTNHQFHSCTSNLTNPQLCNCASNLTNHQLHNCGSNLANNQVHNCMPNYNKPEIQVINMSGTEEAEKSTRKIFPQNKKTSCTKASVTKLSKKPSENSVTTRDQQVQVELKPTITKEDKVKKPVEPIFTIITPKTSDISSSLCSDSSVLTDVVVGVNKKEITLVPKSRESSIRISKNTSANSSAKSKCISTSKTPVKISFEQKTGSASFEVAGLLIDANEKKITILPKRKKSILKNVLSAKSHSLPGSRDSSPTQMGSKSAPTSQHSSPKKNSHNLSKDVPKKPVPNLRKVTSKKCTPAVRSVNSRKSLCKSDLSKQFETKKNDIEEQRSKTQEANIEKQRYKTQEANIEKQRYKIQEANIEKQRCKLQEANVEKPRYKTQETREEYNTPESSIDQGYRTQYTQVSIDSSAESSKINCASESASKARTSRLFRCFQAMMSSHTLNKLHESSDASTTYTSPPTATPGSMIRAMVKVSPILELLNNSKAELLARQVSPVSSPETPSPRTMRLPSNVRRSEKVSKTLKFTSLIDKEMKKSSTEVPKSYCSNGTTSNDNQKSMPKTNRIYQKCSRTCQTSTTNLFQEKSEDIQPFSLKNGPEILEKYEDLKNNCTERIASLTDSIQRLRNEQKGFELSVITNEDSNPIKLNSQLLGSCEMNSQLVSSIETIHAQLKQKLMESRNIISGEGIKLAISPVSDSHLEKSPSISIDLSKNTSLSESIVESAKKTDNPVMPSSNVILKPKIVNEERVNIKLDRFRLRQNSKTSTVADSCKTTVTTATTEAAPEAASSAPDQNEDMVEILSKEILEQSKGINKSPAVDSLKDSDDSNLKSSEPIVKENGESNKNPDSNHLDSNNLDINISDYVPLLAGIPKISRTLAKNPVNGRQRPPVTLISGPYRSEIDSPVHELSTIIEFDTPDTANKSQVSHKSPSNKSRKKLCMKEAPRLTALSPSKIAGVKLTKGKPSVHVAPLRAQRSPQRSLNSSNRSALRNGEKSPRKFAERSLESLNNRKGLKNETKNNGSSDSLHTLPDMHIDQLQQSHDNADGNTEFRISEISELQSLPEENIDRLLISDLQEESKSQSVTTANKHEDKSHITLSDSTSVSRLSGVSEITSSSNSDLKLLKYPSSPEEMELELKKLGLNWAIQTLKKTREASALGSSSSSDGTPVNAAARLVSPVKKQQDSSNHEFPIISDVSSISIKHANKSTEKSLLVKGRTSTPNKFSNNSNTDDTISTLESFSSDLNIVVPNQSADITVNNISFSNDKLG